MNTRWIGGGYRSAVNPADECRNCGVKPALHESVGCAQWQPLLGRDVTDLMEWGERSENG